jgi:hypothetical protein
MAMQISTANHVQTQVQSTTTPAKATGVNGETAKLESSSSVVTISSEAILCRQQDTKRNAFLSTFSPESAADIAKILAYDSLQYGPIGGLIDVSGTLPGGDGILRYSGDGSPVTAESEAYFEKENARFLNEKIEMYTSETANGTPPLKILEKLLIAEDNQPDRYRMMMGWTLA